MTCAGLGKNMESAENLEMLENVLASTMEDFLQLGTEQPGQPLVEREGGQGGMVAADRGGEPLQLHDTGALEAALERAEKRRVEVAAMEQVIIIESERLTGVRSALCNLRPPTATIRQCPNARMH